MNIPEDVEVLADHSKDLVALEDRIVANPDQEVLLSAAVWDIRRNAKRVREAMKNISEVALRESSRRFESEDDVHPG